MITANNFQIWYIRRMSSPLPCWPHRKRNRENCR